MSDEQALVKILELEAIISRLATVRDTVGDLDINGYKDTGAALWAGRKRDGFTSEFDAAKASHSQISEQIGQAISDCKSKQRSLAFSINPLEHPMLSTQAFAIALT